MNRRCVGAAVLFAAFCLSGCGAKDWKDFTSEDGRYRVLLPNGKVKDETQKVPTVLGSVEMKMHGIDLGNQAYAVAYGDYPEIMGLADPEMVLDGVVKGVLQGLHAEKDNESKIKINNFPGREISLHDSKGMKGKIRVALAGRRLYQVMALDTKGNLSDAEKFLHSFQITGPAKANEPKSENAGKL